MKITICSSMRNKNKIQELLELLRKNGIDAFFPNIDLEVPDTGMTTKIMMNLQREHFAAIQSSDIVYILTPDKYVGRMVGIEIGYAKALGKSLIFSKKTEQIELDVLADEFLDAEGLLRVQNNYA